MTWLWKIAILIYSLPSYICGYMVWGGENVWFSFHEIAILNGSFKIRILSSTVVLSFFIWYIIHSPTFYLMVFMSIEYNQHFTVQIKVLIFFIFLSAKQKNVRYSLCAFHLLFRPDGWIFSVWLCFFSLVILVLESICSIYIFDDEIKQKKK